MGTAMNPHGFCGNSVGIPTCQIKQKRIKYALNAKVDVCILPNRVQESCPRNSAGAQIQIGGSAVHQVRREK